MNYATWHYSDEATEDSERLLLDLKVLDAADPMAKLVICGTDKREWKNPLEPDDLFISSRSSKIKALFEKIASLEGKALHGD